MSEKKVIKLKEAATELKIPYSVLKYCWQKKDAPGFNTNYTVNTEIFLPWWDENQEEIERECPIDIDHEKAIGVVKDNLLKDLKIKEAQKNLISPDEIKQFLITVAASQSAVLKKIMNELPPKIAGKSESECKVEIDKAILEIFQILQGKIDTWK